MRLSDNLHPWSLMKSEASLTALRSAAAKGKSVIQQATA
jgi:hypothetical protein